MALFHRSRTSTYWQYCICIVSKMKRDIGWKIAIFHTPPAWRYAIVSCMHARNDDLHSPHPLGGFSSEYCQNIATRFATEKIGSSEDPTVKKRSMIRLAVSTRYRRVTDREKDGRADILRQHSPRYTHRVVKIEYMLLNYRRIKMIKSYRYRVNKKLSTFLFLFLMTFPRYNHSYIHVWVG